MILRMAVDEHHEAALRAAESAHRDRAGSTVAYAIAEHSARGDKQSGHIFGKGGQHACALSLCESLAAYHRNRGRQMPYAGCAARARYDNVVELICERVGLCV